MKTTFDSSQRQFLFALWVFGWFMFTVTFYALVDMLISPVDYIQAMFLPASVFVSVLLGWGSAAICIFTPPALIAENLILAQINKRK